MKILEKSTPIKPLFFFESLFKDSALEKFKEQFYLVDEYFTIESNTKEGYVEKYVNVASDSSLENASLKVQKIYYEDNLKQVLNRELQISKTIINERLRELAFLNKTHDLYLQKQLQILIELNKNFSKLKNNKIEVKDSLDKLSEFILSISKNEKKTINLSIPKGTFFDFKSNIKASVLKEVYLIAEKHQVINEEKFTEEEFVSFFCSSNPKLDGLKFMFNCNNQVAAVFLTEISFMFNSFGFSKISNSEAFYNKQTKILNENDLSVSLSRYSEKIALFRAKLEKELMPLKTRVSK